MNFFFLIYFSLFFAKKYFKSRSWELRQQNADQDNSPVQNCYYQASPWQYKKCLYAARFRDYLQSRRWVQSSIGRNCRNSLPKRGLGLHAGFLELEARSGSASDSIECWCRARLRRCPCLPASCARNLWIPQFRVGNLVSWDIRDDQLQETQVSQVASAQLALFYLNTLSSATLSWSWLSWLSSAKMAHLS